MEYTEFERFFALSCEENGVKPPNPQQLRQFYEFTLYLTEVNAHTNLTAIRSVPDIITKHYVDSLLASEFISEGARVLDLGCGPGFPSIPLAIARPDLTIVALDSTEKKIRFVTESVQKTGLLNLSAVAGRAEDLEIRKSLGSFDVVTSRAVARLNVLCELCLPYAKIGGMLLALKASKAEEELSEAKNAIKALGGGTAILHNRELRMSVGTGEPRALIEVPKIGTTPSKYPRSYAAILKKPL